MKSDWYKNVNPNLDKLAGLLGMGNKPSHGYTIAEKAPEVVTAPGVYFPAQKGEVIPLQPRQEGGNVTPSLAKDNDRAKLEMLNQIISMIKPSGLESRAQGGIVVPPEPMKLEQSKYDILKSALSILKPEKPVSEKPKLESRQAGGDVTPLSGMAEYEANAKKMREEGFGSSMFPKPSTLPTPTTGMAKLPTVGGYAMKPDSLKPTEGDLLYNRLKATSGFPGLDETSMFSRQAGGPVIPTNPDEDEELRRIQMAMNPSGKVGGTIIPQSPAALELAERQKWATPGYPEEALSTARENLRPGENPANVVGVTPGFEPGYYAAHPEERFIEASMAAAKPTLDMQQKLIDEARTRAQGFGLGTMNPKEARLLQAQAAQSLPGLTAGMEKLTSETAAAPIEALKAITRPGPSGPAPHYFRTSNGEMVGYTPPSNLPPGVPFSTGISAPPTPKNQQPYITPDGKTVLVDTSSPDAQKTITENKLKPSPLFGSEERNKIWEERNRLMSVVPNAVTGAYFNRDKRQWEVPTTEGTQILTGEQSRQLGLQTKEEIPTERTKTMTQLAPRVLNLAEKVKSDIESQVAKLGPAAGRWNAFWTGRVGAPNPEFKKLQTDVDLLSTLLANMHVGARGGEQIIARFERMMESGKQSPENLLASIGTIIDYANETKSPIIGKVPGTTSQIGNVIPRLPNESIADYLTRTGGK